ncbi:MAG: MBOAT family protein, partial [Bacteroidota bacterium]
MIFNSLTFLSFIAVFLPVYFLLKGKARLAWSLLGSYMFYGWWDWRFLGLIIVSTVVDYWLGLKIDERHDEQKRKWMMNF